jgi:dihydroneopterin triphosphate diphosphatase
MEKHNKVQVVVIATRNNKEYLLSLRTIKKNGSFWQNITGSVDPGESFYDGATRELFEETGIKLNQNQKLIEIDFQNNFHDKWDRDVVEKSYAVKISDIINVHLSAEEHDHYQWIDCNEVSAENFKYASNFEVFKLAWKKLC